MKTSNVEPEEKKFSLFDLLNIAETIKTPWKDLTEEQQKVWNPFMINRFISSREQYTPIISLISKYNWTPENHYNFICSLLDGTRKHYFNYQAYKKDKVDEDQKLLIYACSKEYEIGAREAKMYIEDLKDEEKEALKTKWKDKYDYDTKS